jgi:hypothetical protein
VWGAVAGSIVLNVLAADPGPPTCNTADPRIETALAAKAKELEGAEHCQNRMYEAHQDVDSDGKNDLIVVFSIEDVHGDRKVTRQFLAAFPSRTAWTASVVELDAITRRPVQRIAVVAGAILVETGERCRWGAECGAIVSEQLGFKVKDGRLVVTGPGVDCGDRLKVGGTYGDWHRGPTLAFSGLIVFKKVNPCAQGTCFEAEMMFENGYQSQSYGDGYWKGSEINITRHLHGSTYAQTWQGQCLLSDIQGRWRLVNDSNPDSGIFIIQY